MKTKKISLAVILAVVMTALVCACSFNTSMSFTFNVETGDSIKVKLDTSNGLLLTQNDGQFAVMKDEETILSGMFITKDTYDEYMALEESGQIDVLEKNTDGNKKYMLYKYDGESGTEYDFVVWINGSDTGVLMGSIAGESNAKTAFSSISFSVE